MGNESFFGEWGFPGVLTENFSQHSFFGRLKYGYRYKYLFFKTDISALVKGVYIMQFYIAAICFR